MEKYEISQHVRQQLQSVVGIYEYCKSMAISPKIGVRGCPFRRGIPGLIFTRGWTSRQQPCSGCVGAVIAVDGRRRSATAEDRAGVERHKTDILYVYEHKVTKHISFVFVVTSLIGF